MERIVWKYIYSTFCTRILELSHRIGFSDKFLSRYNHIPDTLYDFHTDCIYMSVYLKIINAVWNLQIYFLYRKAHTNNRQTHNEINITFFAEVRDGRTTI